MWAFQHFGTSWFCSFSTFWLDLSFVFLRKFQCYIWIPAAHTVCILQHCLCESAVQVFYIITPAFSRLVLTSLTFVLGFFFTAWRICLSSAAAVFHGRPALCVFCPQAFSFHSAVLVISVSYVVVLNDFGFCLLQISCFSATSYCFCSSLVCAFLLLAPSAVSQWLNYCSTGSDQHS